MLAFIVFMVLVFLVVYGAIREARRKEAERHVAQKITRHLDRLDKEGGE